MSIDRVKLRDLIAAADTDPAALADLGTRVPALLAELDRLEAARVSTRPDLDAIRARADKATPGPWRVVIDDSESATTVWRECDSANHPLIEDPGRDYVFDDCRDGELHSEPFFREQDADFIAHARTDVPRLLDALAAASKRITELEGAVELSNSTLHAVLLGIAEDYRQCIAAARGTMSASYYQELNGRAEAYRQAATRLAEQTGLPVPDWDRIRREVPADGVYRQGGAS